MRYLGNKTKLLPAIEGLLREKGIEPPGVFFDVFSGTGSVARRMKELGFRVVANDHMVCAATQARAAVGLDSVPSFRGVLARRDVAAFARSWAGREAIEAVPCEPEARGLRVAVAFLNQAPGREGLVFRQYSAGGRAGRRFFTAEIGRRIDGVRAAIARWREDGSLTRREEPVLLAALIDAADRCANISGTYGAFLKTWQPNARGPLALRAPAIVPGRGSRIHCEDGNALVPRVDATVLYIDPPYNRRQYSKNYHVLEVLAELPEVEDEAAYEQTIYGRTGLRDFPGRRSAYCLGGAEEAFSDLLEKARAEHIVISYSEEGILSRDALERAVRRAVPDFDMARGLVEVSYKRFRSDKDDGKRRRYRVLEHRSRDEVREWLVYARTSRQRAVAPITRS